uniref:Sorting nexin-17 n=2 Tax=Macrostomum lignano TaxID=282301 RepID=A0A1I8H4Y7_9PLAT
AESPLLNTADIQTGQAKLFAFASIGSPVADLIGALCSPMHFSIPEYEQVSDSDGASYTSYKIYVNGVFHCSTRFSELRSFYDALVEGHGARAVPAFPPKRLFGLTASQLGERRAQLELFVQQVSQDPALGGRFQTFLQGAQKASRGLRPEPVELQIGLMTGKRCCLSVLNTDRTDDVLEAFAKTAGLSERFAYYFGLFLVATGASGQPAVLRRLQDFELPCVSLAAAQQEAESARLVVRKAFWDSLLENELYDEPAALRLLYAQACADLDNGWILPSREQADRLADYRQSRSRRDFLRLARTCRFYGFLPFPDCFADWPTPDTPAVVWIGNKELVVRPQSARTGGVFRVVRMRRWRLSTPSAPGATAPNSRGDSVPCHELSFEYLVAPDSLKWFRINTHQAVLLSLCLQSVVDEVVMKKAGGRIRTPADRDRGRDPADLNDFVDRQRPFTRRVGGAEDHQSLAQRLAHWSAADSAAGAAATVADNDSFVHAIGDDDL